MPILIMLALVVSAPVALASSRSACEQLASQRAEVVHKLSEVQATKSQLSEDLETEEARRVADFGKRLTEIDLQIKINQSRILVAEEMILLRELVRPIVSEWEASESLRSMASALLLENFMKGPVGDPQAALRYVIDNSEGKIREEIRVQFQDILTALQEGRITRKPVVFQLINFIDEMMFQKPDAFVFLITRMNEAADIGKFQQAILGLEKKSEDTKVLIAKSEGLSRSLQINLESASRREGILLQELREMNQRHAHCVAQWKKSHKVARAENTSEDN